MGLNLARERERQAELKTSSNSKTWKPQEGENNIIRVLMFKHKVVKADIEAKLYGKKDDKGKETLGQVYDEWAYPFTVHYGLVAKNRKIPVLSNPEIMAVYNKLKASKDPDERKQADDIKPNTRCAMNIVDINEPTKGVQIYLAPKTVRTFIGDHVNSKDYGEDVLGVKGRDWRITYAKNADIKDKYKLIIMPEKSCRAMNSKVEGMVKDLFDPEINGEFAQSKDMDDLDVPEGETAKPPVDLEGDKASANGKGGGDIFDAE